MIEIDSPDLANRLEHEADELEHRNQQPGQRTEDVAREWESKRRDPNVPGAPPDDDDDSSDDDDDEHDGGGWDDPEEDENEDEDYDEDE